MRLIIHTDGGSRGNPGLAGGGMVVLDETKREIFSDHFHFGTKTNNEAEYLAVIQAMKWLQTFAKQQTVEAVRFILDSKLVVEQLSGHWKIRETRLMALADECRQIMANLPFSVQFFHVKRHENARADLLANQAMDAATE
jgi:ribonuclease HI